MARCALAQGKLDDAHKQGDEAWNYIREHGIFGFLYPFHVYVILADLFDALGETAQSRAVIEAGYQALSVAADKISNPEWRRSFLENIEENHMLVELWQRIQEEKRHGSKSKH